MRRLSRWAATALLISLFLAADLALYADNALLFFSFLVLAVTGVAAVLIGLRAQGLFSWQAGIPLYYLLYFIAFPFVEQASGVTNYEELRGIPGALLLTSLGLLTFIIGTGAGALLTGTQNGRFYRGVAERSPFVALEGKPVAIAALVLGIGASIWSINYGYFGLRGSERGPDSPFAGVASIVSSFLEIVLMVSAMRASAQDDKRGFWRLLATVSVVVSLALGLFAFSKTALIRPLVIVIVARYMTQRRISWWALGGLAAFFALLAFPLVVSLRDIAAQADIRADPIASTLNLLTSDELAHSVLAGPESAKANVGGVLGRGLLTMVGRVASTAGDSVPFLNGSSYTSGFETLVPKFIWEDKAKLNVGNSYGQLLGVLPHSDVLTNISISQIGESYLNFGVLGLALIMLAWGIFARFVDTVLSGAPQSWFRLLMFMNIGWQEAAWSNTVPPFLKQFLALAIIILIIDLLFRSFQFLLGGAVHVAPYKTKRESV